MLADHYKGNGGVAGFNLPNEPADEEGGRLIAWYSEAAHRVREIDADRMLFLDGNKYSTDFSMFTEPLPNTVYTAHDYVVAGLDPHGHYPGELDGRYPGSAKGDVYNKDTIHEQFLRRTAFMRDLGLPIWIGELARFTTAHRIRPRSGTNYCRISSTFTGTIRRHGRCGSTRTSDCRAWFSPQPIAPT